MPEKISAQTPSQSPMAGKKSAISPSTNHATSGKGPSDDTSNQDRVTLSGAAMELSMLASKLAELPIVDDQRVAKISSALNNGSFEIDASRVAMKLLQFEIGLGTNKA